MADFATPQPGDKFLWVRYHGLGDLLEAMADAYQVKRKFPDIRLSFLSCPEYTEILKSQPYIEDVIYGGKSPLRVMKQTAQTMKNGNYNWVASTFKGVHMTIMAYMSGIQNRLGSSKYLPFLETANIYDWTKAHGINLFQRTEKSLFASEENIAFAKNILAPLQDKKKIFCVIGASKVAKMWPTKYWIDFLKPLVSEGWTMVLNGYGTTEQAVADKIVAALPQKSVLNLVGKLDFVHMIGVASECHATVGHDTGPLHLATLCGIPTVGIFDYIPPKETGYNLPWLTLAVAREEKLQTFYAKKREAAVLAELKTEKVREKFNELVEKYNL